MFRLLSCQGAMRWGARRDDDRRHTVAAATLLPELAVSRGCGGGCIERA
jgi:hypothetical protein